MQTPAINVPLATTPQVIAKSLSSQSPAVAKYDDVCEVDGSEQ